MPQQAKGDAVASELAAIFTQPPKDGKQTYKILVNKNNPDKINTRRPTNRGRTVAWLVGPKGDKFPIILVDQGKVNFSTYANVEKAMQLILKFANAWPDAPLDQVSFRLMVAEVAVAVMSPTSVRIKAPTWRAWRGWKILIPYFNTETHQIEEYSRTAYAGLSLDVSFPDIPADAELYRFPEKDPHPEVIGKGADGRHLSLLPTDRDVLQDRCFTQSKSTTTTTIDEIRNRERFERFISWKLAGRKGTGKQMQAAIMEYEALYVSAKRFGRKSAAAHRLFRVWYAAEHKLTYIDVRKFLREQLNGVKIPKFSIRSPNFAWIPPILEASRRKWRETHDGAATLLELANLVDISNQELRAGNPPLGQRTSPTSARNAEASSCATRDKDKTPLNVMILKQGLQTSFRKEAASMGRPWKDPQIQQVYDEAYQSLMDQLKDCNPDEWFDSYSSSIRKIPPTFNPFFPSVDAIDRLTCRPAPNGTLQTWTHAAPNVVCVPHAINMAKGNAHVGSLAEIGAHCAASEAATEEEKRQLDEKLMARVAEHRAITLKYGFARKKAAQLEFRSGKYSTGNSVDLDTALKESFRTYSNPIICLLEEEDKERVVTICDEIEGAFGVDIPRSKEDGAPCPFKHEMMPDTWNWTDLHAFVRERHQRMKFTCNKYWETVDSLVGLACEVFYQVYSSAPEFLGLPLSGVIMNPLRISVAHKIHGKQMRTGWPVTPRRLGDRKAEDNNILVETWFSNCLKYDFGEQHYESLRVYIKTLRIPKHIYDRDAEVPTLPAVEFDMSAEDDPDVMLPEAHNMAPDDIESVLAALNQDGEDEDGDSDDDQVQDNITVRTDEEEEQDEVEEVKAKTRRNTQRNTHASKEPKQSDAMDAGLKRLKQRAQAARKLVDIYEYTHHKEVVVLTARILDGFLLESRDQTSMQQLTEEVDTLAKHVKLDETDDMDGMSTTGPAASGRNQQRPSAAGPAATGPRFNHFRRQTQELLTTSQFTTTQPIDLFDDMINSNPNPHGGDFDRSEIAAFLLHMADMGEVKYDPSTEVVGRADDQVWSGWADEPFHGFGDDDPAMLDAADDGEPAIDGKGKGNGTAKTMADRQSSDEPMVDAERAPLDEDGRQGERNVTTESAAEQIAMGQDDDEDEHGGNGEDEDEEYGEDEVGGEGGDEDGEDGDDDARGGDGVGDEEMPDEDSAGHARYLAFRDAARSVLSEHQNEPPMHLRDLVPLVNDNLAAGGIEVSRRETREYLAELADVGECVWDADLELVESTF
ncbi:hypothetical protein KVT40_000517 [Elsinoe batatas]|uniref:Uncharacterized protein n=1 Tax=Elsinoe batatas TaxID=2601811 RepID=A0A8K0L9G2_9PEZI|nr:hypothetical protein KVT40_000517 [Elsinoe batatas]